MSGAISTSRWRWRHWALVLLVLCAVAAAFAIAPIPQDPAYHRFIDSRTIAGVPHFWNVVSNLGFPLVALFGLSCARTVSSDLLRPAYLTFCIAILAVGIGSAWYHYAPSTPTLVWDRLPMSVAFMALFSLVFTDRMDPFLGRRLLWPLVLLGIGSVLYWYWTELQGRGDLRAYGLVQFLPMVLIPVLLLACPGSRRSTSWLWLTLAGYLLAKLAEHFDALLYEATGLSGHSIKHLLAAIAVLCAICALLRLEPPRPARTECCSAA